MRSLFSKVLGIVLSAFIAVSAVFTSGCAKALTSGPAIPKSTMGDYPKSVDIAYPGFFYPSNYNRNDVYDAENGDKWIDNISIRYDVDLNVTTNTNDANGIIRSLLSGSRTADVVTGFVYMSNANLVEMYADPRTIQPLEGYLENNPVWKSLPQAVRDAFTVDGHVWAIPCAYMTVSPQVRAYDPDILSSVGMEAPETVEDFSIFTQKAAALQKNGVSKNTITDPMCSYPYYCAADILRAYGIYTSGYGLISYDPVEDCITDGFLKPDAEEALSYLRDLYTKGVLDMEFTGDNVNAYRTALYKQDGYSTAYLGSYTTSLAYYGALNKYDCVTGLSRNGAVCPQVLDVSFAGYVLAANTPEPQKCVNFLLDLFFGSKYNYYETRYGSDKNYTINSDGTISINLTEDGTYPKLPNLLGRIEGLNMGDEYSGYDPQLGNSTFQYNVGVALNKLRTDAIQNKTAVAVPVINQYAIRLCRYYSRDLMQNINAATNTCFADAITDSSRSVKEVLETYRAAMRECGAQPLLDQANALINKTGLQIY